jgi:serine phosphatase RsbU (regulator of sigma subunit)
MRLRTQLVLAAFLLAIVPLVAIVVYSYESSRKALEAAYRRQSARMTRQMDVRLSSIRAELDTGLAGLSALPMGKLPTAATRQNAPISEFVMAMGEAAPLVDALSFEPTHVAPPAPPARPAPHPRAIAETAAESAVEAATDAALEMAPVVIDLPRIPRFQMPPDFQEKMKEIRSLTHQLEKTDPAMSETDRKAASDRIKELNASIKTEMEQRSAEFEVKVESAMQKRAEERLKRRAAVADQNGNIPVEVPGPKPAIAPREPQRIVVERRTTEDKQQSIEDRKTMDLRREQLRQRAREATLLLGRDLNVPLHTDGKVVGHVTAQIRPDEVIRRVLGTPVDDSEIAFAVDREGHLYTRNDAERTTVESAGLQKHVADGRQTNVGGWLLTSKLAGNGLRLAVARKAGDEFEELRNTAARNFGYGLGLVFIALIGIVPLANHMSRDVQRVTLGAARIADGDLQTRVPVHSKNEFGQLAVAFNKMAHDLSEQRQRLYEEERARREQEVQQKILEGKAEELEEARRFQLSLLPKEVPRLDRFEVAAFTQTATEVGGDYYDFGVDDGALTITIGDATGHGAKAGTMVTVVKTLFSSYANEAPGAFLGTATERIKRMAMERMSMALSLARVEDDKVTIASAGMPPLLVARGAESRVEEVAFSSTPLGTLGSEYAQREIALSEGDTLLFMTDGFPELTNGFGQQLGYPGALEAFANVASGSAQEVIDGLVSHARGWHGDHPPNDDMTFVVVKMRRSA